MEMERALTLHYLAYLEARRTTAVRLAPRRTRTHTNTVTGQH